MILKRIVVISAFGFMLAGCGPTVPMEFGMPQAQYQKLSHAQQQRVIAAYNQQQAEAAQRQTLWNALGAVGGMMNINKTIEHSHHSSCSGGSCTSSGSHVRVGID